MQALNVCKLDFYVLYGDNTNPVKLHTNTNCSLTPTFLQLNKIICGLCTHGHRVQISFRRVIFVQSFRKTTLHTLTNRSKTLIFVTNKYSIDKVAASEQSQIIGL